MRTSDAFIITTGCGFIQNKFNLEEIFMERDHSFLVKSFR